MAGKGPEKNGKTPETAGAPEREENKFSKEQLVFSLRFRDRRDIVEALLEEGGMYTVKAVEEKIEKYMKGKVK